MAGRKPDSDVLVAIPYTDGGGNDAMQFHNVGAAWKNENGMIWFNLVTNPNVRFVIRKREEKKQEGGGAV
jgi:hypothetical protein